MAEAKRPIYFTSQFLVEDDFKAEQAYQVDMRRLHNASLHTWGVVNGLEVTRGGGSQVSVSAGMAIDKDGREIVLPATRAPQTLDLSTVASGSSVFITITFDDKTRLEEDRYTGAGLVDKFTRATERPELKAVPSALDDGSVIKLALVTVTAGDVKIDSSVRRLASSLIPSSSDLEVRSLKWGNSRLQPDSEGVIDLGGDASTAGTGSPHIDFHFLGKVEDFNARIVNDADGRLTFQVPVVRATGSLGIGTPTPGAKLTIQQGATTAGAAAAGKALFVSAAMGSGAASDGAIEFRHDNLTQGIGFGFNTIYATGSSANQDLTIQSRGAGNLFLNPTQGNVGIGSAAAPDRNLTLRKTGPGTGVFANVKNDTHEILIGVDTAAILSAMTASDLHIRTNNAIRMLVQANTGNVGIGTTNPGARLEVAGDLKLSGVRTKLFYRGDTDAQIGSLAFYSPDGGATAIITPYNSTGGNLPTSTIRLGGFGSLDSNAVSLRVSGNVSIGTAAAGEALTVNGRIQLGALSVGPWPANPVYMFFGTNALDQSAPGNYALLQSSSGTDLGVTFLNSPESLRFRIGNADRMVLTKEGRVGIGTTNPASTLEVNGAIRAANSDIYFSETAHNHTGIGNANGFAAIENAANFNALMILGRASGPPLRRLVQVWDVLEVHGDLVVTNNMNVTGRLTAPIKTGCVVDKFVNKFGETLEQGDLVVIGENQSSLYYGLNNYIPIPEIDIAVDAYDTRVCGIISEVHGELAPESEPEPTAPTKGKKTKQTAASKKASSAAKLQAREFTSEEMSEADITKVGPDQIGLMVTQGAFAHCKVDADIAPIKVGDLLTTSPTRGHAQKVLDLPRATGAIVGKALGSLKKGKGLIPVLVSLQ